MIAEIAPPGPVVESMRANNKPPGVSDDHRPAPPSCLMCHSVSIPGLLRAAVGPDVHVGSPAIKVTLGSNSRR